MPLEGFHPLCMIWAGEGVIDSDKFTIKQVDPKVLYSATRPKRVQEFMNIHKFMSVWIGSKGAFEQDPPEIALAYTSMPKGNGGIARAVPIKLTQPIEKTKNCWQFELTFSEKVIASGTYHDIALFIDWFPSAVCPKPIQILFPEGIL